MSASAPGDDLDRYYDLTERAFSRLAPVYDLVAMPIAGVRDDVVRFAGAPTGAAVLDVATGTGAQAFAFARRGHPVVGVDISEDMLAVARRKDRFQAVSFVRGDATRLPFGDGTFGCAVVSYALHDMPPTVRGQVLREMARVVGPKGIVVIVDYGRPTSGCWRWVLHGLIATYEGPYFRSFVATDVEALLGEAGIETEAERQLRLGLAQIIRGRVVASAADKLAGSPDVAEARRSCTRRSGGS